MLKSMQTFILCVNGAVGKKIELRLAYDVRDKEEDV